MPENTRKETARASAGYYQITVFDDGSVQLEHPLKIGITYATIEPAGSRIGFNPVDWTDSEKLPDLPEPVKELKESM